MVANSGSIGSLVTGQTVFVAGAACATRRGTAATSSAAANGRSRATASERATERPDTTGGVAGARAKAGRRRDCVGRRPQGPGPTSCTTAKALRSHSGAPVTTARKGTRAAATPREEQMTALDFDHVSVGAGSAGCLLAERLSASGRSGSRRVAGGHAQGPRDRWRPDAGTPRGRSDGSHGAERVAAMIAEGRQRGTAVPLSAVA